MLAFIIVFFSFLLDYISSLCLKDLSHAVTTELIRRLEKDPTVLKEFYHNHLGLIVRKCITEGWKKLGNYFQIPL